MFITTVEVGSGVRVGRNSSVGSGSRLPCRWL
ncbi:MAG: hypothetical protein K8L97_16705 [Anaerolineae bacterium]|nr:hypothetical protein [Anaerolineae bacterium]